MNIFRLTFPLMAILSGCGVVVPLGLDFDSPVIPIYNPKSPPRFPPYGQLAPWVRTQSMDFDTSNFESLYYKGMTFRLKYPKGYRSTKEDQKRYPLLLIFPGRDEKGTIFENEKQLFHGGLNFGSPSGEQQFEGFLLFPQSTSPRGVFRDDHLKIIGELIETHLIPKRYVDPARVIIHGFSSGVSASWKMVNLFPQLIAAVLPAGILGEEFNSADFIEKIKFKNISIYEGRNDPDRPTVYSRYLLSKAIGAGANIHHTSYRWEDHLAWLSAWKDPKFYANLKNIHMANPWPLYGQTEFCGNHPFNTYLGVTGGFEGYQWRKNGSVIEGETGHVIAVSSFGKFDCRILRNGAWTEWSPVAVEIKPDCNPSPAEIELDDLASRVLPSPDGKATIRLAIGRGYKRCEWERDGMRVPSMTECESDVSEPGVYQAKLISVSGNGPVLSVPVNVVDANGMQGPPPVYNLQSKGLSPGAIKLTWDQDQVPRYDESEFEVYRASYLLNGYQEIARLGRGADSFHDKNLATDTNYFYLITVTSEDGTVRTVRPEVKIDPDGSSRRLSFSIPCTDEFEAANLALLRATASLSEYQLLGRVAANSSEYIDNNAKSGTYYSYIVRAVNNSGSSPNVSLDRVAGLHDAVPPLSPKNLRYTQILDDTVELGWNRSEDNLAVATYLIERLDLPKGQPGTEDSLGLPYFRVKGLPRGKSQLFAVRASDASLNKSAYSNSIRVFPQIGGLSYYHFKYTSPAVQEFPVNERDILSQGIIENVAIDSRLLNENYGFYWRGLIRVPVAGLYQFRLESDGWSALSFGAERHRAAAEMIQSQRGAGLSIERSLDISTEGTAIEVSYLNPGKGGSIKLFWKTPQGVGFEEVPNAAFSD